MLLKHSSAKLRSNYRPDGRPPCRRGRKNCGSFGLIGSTTNLRGKFIFLELGIINHDYFHILKSDIDFIQAA